MHLHRTRTDCACKAKQKTGRQTGKRTALQSDREKEWQMAWRITAECSVQRMAESWARMKVQRSVSETALRSVHLKDQPTVQWMARPSVTRTAL